MDHSENACSVCSERISIYAIGACDHPICYKCSTRMRVLCDHMYCPICRTNLPQVLLVNQCDKYESLKTRGWQSFRKCQIYFEDKYIKNKFFELLDNKCPICKDRPPDRQLADLSRHMRRDHEVFFCDLCVEHLKIFTFERKYYDRKQLATHRREGDANDTSYKGHPLCEFCDIRYLDNDELSRHLRKDHYYCHFCDSDGSQQYFSEYPVLKEHFREDHYLCEEGECINLQFTHAFRSEIDLKAHKANYHNKGMKRSFAKQARTLDVEFSLAPRSRPERNYRGYGDSTGRGGGRQGRDRYNNNNYRQDDSDPELVQALQASRNEEKKREQREKNNRKSKAKEVQEKPPEKPKEVPVEEFKNSSGNFPTLSGKESPELESRSPVPPDDSPAPPTSSSSLAQRLALSEGHTVQSGRVLEEDFPSLGRPASAPSNTGRWVTGGRRNISTSKKDFPALSESNRPISSVVHTQARQQPVQTPLPKPVPQFSNTQSTPSSTEDFPGLPKTARNIRAQNSTTPKGSWGNKSKDNKPEPEKAPKKKPKGSGKKEAELPDGLTLADVGKSLHDDSFLSVKSVKKAPLPEMNTNNSKSKNKTKKKKEKENVIKSDEGFAGYPVKEKEVVEEVKPEKSKSTKDMDNNKENNDVLIRLSEISVSNKQPTKEEPWVQVSVGKKPWTMVDSMEDFPDLSVNSSKPKPPPGFSKPPVSSPPPGFSANLSRPPPGFVKPVLSSNNSIQTADIMSIPNIDVNLIPMYSKPSNFTERNKSLIENIRSSLYDDADKFNLFKTWSGEFRQGALPAKVYYEQCVTLLGKDNFAKLFPELLVLLPDITKQKELLEIHLTREKSSKKKGWNTSANSIFYTCPNCQQVLINDDKPEHLSLHSNDSDFPSLSNSSSPSTWIRAT